MNRPPACPRLSDERGNSESYWSGLTKLQYYYTMYALAIEMDMILHHRTYLLTRM